VGVDPFVSDSNHVFKLTDSRADAAHFLNQFGGTLFGLAQLAADHVSAGAKLVRLGDGGTSLLVQLKEFAYGRGRSSGLHCAADHVRIVAYEFQA
jgi:hypothetical protein